jgi:hypothetical protein
MDYKLIFVIAGIVVTMGMIGGITNNIPIILAASDSQCENQHEREDRFLDRYEADPDNNGKLQSFISSFKNTEPC